MEDPSASVKIIKENHLISTTGFEFCGRLKGSFPNNIPHYIFLWAKLPEVICHTGLQIIIKLQKQVVTLWHPFCSNRQPGGNKMINRGYDSPELFQLDTKIRLLKLNNKIQDQVKKIRDLLAKVQKTNDEECK